MSIIDHNRQETYAGCVLSTRERNGRDDSDWYALVWDAAEGRLREIEYASTRYAGSGDAQVDATDEVRRLADEWARVQLRPVARQSLEAIAREIKLGDEVRSTSTRGKNKGLTAEVVRFTFNSFRPAFRSGYNKPEPQVQVRLLDGSFRFWTLDRTEKVHVREVSEAEVEALISRMGANNWQATFCTPYGMVRVG